MTETKQENKLDTTPAADPATHQPAAAQAKTATDKSEPAIKPEMSKGERAYNVTVYNILNYWVNLGSSLVIADFFLHNHVFHKPKLTWGGQPIKIFGKEISGPGMITWSAEKLGSAISTFGIGKETAIHNTRTALQTLALMSGGWLLLIPLKLLEDDKRGWVHWANRKLGVSQCGPDGREKTKDEIYIEQEQPRQSWLNVIKRRIIATIAVVGTGQLLNFTFRDRSQPKEVDGKDTHGGKAVIERFVVGNVNKALRSGWVPGGSWLADKKMFQRYLGMAALDTAFTKITSVTMYLTNGAKKARMEHEIGDEVDPPGRDVNNHIEILPDGGKQHQLQLEQSGSINKLAAIASKTPHDSFAQNVKALPSVSRTLAT